jgi:hypothetical protein
VTPSASQQPAVIVMVKAPIAGTVKTRLTPPLPADEAARLAAAFAQDMVAGALRTGAAVVIAYAPDDGRSLLGSILPGGLHWVPQQGGDLGERMSRAMADAQALGFGPIVIVGTDSPTLPTFYVTQALAALLSTETDLVLGPADDGGYYLFGARRKAPGLFDSVAWSTPQAFADTRANAARLGLRCRTLPPWYDIDTLEDLRRLRRELDADGALRLRAPSTALWFRRHSEIIPAPPSDVHPRTIF